MKKIFLTSVAIAWFFMEGFSQSVIADPAVNFMRTVAAGNAPVDPFAVPLDSVFELKVPVINYNQVNALPSGSCKIKIGLGSRMIVDPSFDLNTVNTSNYFRWTAEATSGQVQITGELIANLPGNFLDTATFRVKGSVLGSSTVTTNFLVTNHNTAINLSDENGTNNNTSLAYTVVEVIAGPVPVTFTKITTSNESCHIKVDFYTENEINVDRFEIEVSTNRIIYEKAGMLPAANAGHYQFVYPVTTALASPHLFTRIKSVDIDSRYQYSGVSRVAGECILKEQSVIVFPNPAPVATGYFMVRSEKRNFNGSYTISLRDMAGKLLIKKQLLLNNTSQFKFDHGYLPAGQYLINIQQPGNEEQLLLKWKKG